jgi:hypothetical protein
MIGSKSGRCKVLRIIILLGRWGSLRWYGAKVMEFRVGLCEIWMPEETCGSNWGAQVVQIVYHEADEGYVIVLFGL